MGRRFGFGRNWKHYSKLIDPARLEKAEKHLQDRFKVEKFNGNFLDIGSGSGVFSAAALNLGANVKAFDYDINSVETSKKIIAAFAKGKTNWEVSRGDILTPDHNQDISQSDYIYAWGVLHHTGDMKLAIETIASNASIGTRWVIAIYNDLGKKSVTWTKLKKLYVRVILLRPFLLVYAYCRFWAKQQINSLIHFRNPFTSWRDYTIDSRGMSAWYDLIDWAGGYPFEVATPDWIVAKIEPFGWEIQEIWRNNAVGNNEFLFIKTQK
jgi:2-polyprenyl-6-hydroxyphenyl methylase/3-demethylubiquinone-9 3-methyltransferase